MANYFEKYIFNEFLNIYINVIRICFVRLSILINDNIFIYTTINN